MIHVQQQATRKETRSVAVTIDQQNKTYLTYYLEATYFNYFSQVTFDPPNRMDDR